MRSPCTSRRSPRGGSPAVLIMAILGCLGTRLPGARGDVSGRVTTGGFEPTLESEPLYQRLLLPAFGPGAEASGKAGSQIKNQVAGQVAGPANDQIISQIIRQAETQLAWCQEVLGEGHRSTAEAETHLGMLLLDRGDFAAAARHLSQALEIDAALLASRSSPGGQGSGDIPAVLDGLLPALEAQGHYASAVEAARRALAGKAGWVGELGDRARIALILSYLSANPAEPKNLDEAARMAESFAAALPLLPPVSSTTPPPSTSEGRDALRRAGAAHELLSTVLLHLGQWERAEAEERQVMETLAARDADPVDVSAAQNNLAVLLARYGRDGEAEALLQRAIALRGRALGEGDLRTALPQRNLAALYFRGGQVARAEGPLQKAQVAVVKALGSSHPRSIQQLFWLGALYAELEPTGARAEVFLRRAVQLSVGVAGAAADAREQLARFLLGKGRLDEAWTLASEADEARQKAAGTAGAASPATLRGLLLLAEIERQRRHSSAAHVYVQRALDGLDASHSPESTEPTEPIDRAESAESRATQAQRQGAAEQDPLTVLLRGRYAADVLSAPTDSGPLAVAPGRAAPALSLSAQALKGLLAYDRGVAPYGPAPQIARAAVAGALAALTGTLIAALGDGALPPEVAATLLRAVDADEVTEGELSELSRLQRAESIRDAQVARQMQLLLRRRAALLLLPGEDRQGQTPAPPGAAVRRLDGLIDASAAEVARRSPRLAALLARGDLDLFQIESRLHREEASLLVLLRAAAPPRPAEPAASPAPQNSSIVISRDGVALPSLRMDGGVAPDAPPAESRTGSAASSAPKDSTSDDKDGKDGKDVDRYAALIVSPGHPARLIPLGPVALVDAAAERLFRATEAGHDPVAELGQLGGLLLSPLADALPVSRRLYVQVVPELAGLPLSALPLPDGRLLCTRGAVALLSSVGELLTDQPRPTSAPRPPPLQPLQPMLLLGAPLLRDPLFPGLRSTPPIATPKELIDLSHLLRGHRYDSRGGPLIGLAATKSRLRAWLPSSVVHLLAPLFFLAGAPERSATGDDDGDSDADPAHLVPDRLAAHLTHLGVSLPLSELGSPQVPPQARAGVALAAFSRVAPGGVQISDDGALSEGELAGLDLSHTALLVLSGPPAAAAPRRLGPGLWALHRAAHRAGAQAVVSTLWRPPDAAARKLMVDLYSAWLHEGDAAQAIRDVQLAMQKSGQPPLLWAGLAVSTTPSTNASTTSTNVSQAP